MVTRRCRFQMALLTAIGVATAISNQLSAHEVNIHRLITDAALDYLVQNHPELAACNVPSMRTLFEQAVTDEDNDFGKFTFPYGRYFFHFLPRLNDLDVNTIIPTTVYASCNSPQWGLQPNEDKSCVEFTSGLGLRSPEDNVFTFDSAAIADLASTPEDLRKRSALLSLGHLLHLLQDMASPPHTLNDAHPHTDSSVLELFGDPSAFEVLNSTRTSIPKPLPLEPDILSEADAFNQLQAFVSSHFLSEKSGLLLDPLTTPTDANGFAVEPGTGRLKARLFTGRNFFVIDYKVATAQFAELNRTGIMGGQLM